MKHLKTYKVFESEFFDNDYIDTLLDKISDSGIESLSDIEKNQLKLFSEDDIEIIETIEKMADITRQFKEINRKMKDIQSEGGDAKYLMEDWLELNNQLVPLEQSFRKWGIELGDPRLDRLMRKTRPDAYNNIFESVNKKSINDFMFDFGMLITMGFSQITKMGVDQKATDELSSMMKRLREPLINGKKYSEIIDDVNFLYKNPKILSAFIGQIRELLLYIEPRVKNYVKDCDVKDNWLGKIDKFKERYKEIIS